MIIILPDLLAKLIQLINNETFWIAISSLATLGLLLFATKGFYKDLKEKRDILNLEVSPFVSLEYSIDYDLGAIYIQLKNYGKSPAYDINIDFSKELSSPFWLGLVGASTGDINNISWFKNPIKYLAPNQSIKVLYSNYEYIAEAHRKAHKNAEGIIRYYGRRKKETLESKFFLDPTILWPLSAKLNDPLNATLKNINATLKEINSSLENIA